MSTLALKEDLYAPNIDDKGRYVDHIPNIIHGIKCPCGARKDKIYTTNQLFSAHTKTKQHIKWLESLNNNRANYYMETLQLRDTVQMQQQIIARLENDLKNKSNTIDYLTIQLHKPCINNKESIDLLDINLD